MGEFEADIQTRAAVVGLHNFREFSQLPERLDEAKTRRKKHSSAFIKYF